MRRPLPPEISSRLEGIRVSGEGYDARCPVHEDRNASLSVKVNETGKLLVHCHAGCDQRAVLDAIAATPQMLRGDEPDRRDDGEWTPRGPAIAVYDYIDEQGTLLFSVCRTADKQFPQRRPDPAAKSGWSWKLGDTRRVLYRLPQVLAAIHNGETLWIAEGEKDVHALEAAGVVATCSPGGAGKWRDEYAEHLADADVVVVADKDKPGQAHARAVAVSIGKRGGRVRIVEAREGKDAADHLRAGFGLEDFLTTHESDVAAKPELALDIWDYIAQDDGEMRWIVPGMIERGDRIMVTAHEGFAKSTFLRQLGVAVAAGLHPFTGEHIEPARVLFIDCENGDRQTRRAFRWILPIARLYGSDVPRDTFFPLVRPEGIDLGREEDSEWLLERVTAHKPDVLVIGPVYRLLVEDANTDVTIRKIITAIDRARVAADCAVVLEAHAGHGGGFGKSRETRPIGSSMWMRWVEAGIGLAPFDGTDELAKTPLRVDHWKPSRDRDLKEWPRFIRHGGRGRDGEMREWPWVPDELYGPDGQLVTA